MAAIVLFDGVCNLCNRSVNFIISRDKKSYFRFAPLQSETGKKVLKQYPAEGGALSSIILIENEKVYKRSDATLRIIRHLGVFWALLYIFIFIPRFLRDPFYNIIARYRYQWFGKRDTCRLPLPEEKERFLC